MVIELIIVSSGLLLLSYPILRAFGTSASRCGKQAIEKDNYLRGKK